MKIVSKELTTHAVELAWSLWRTLGVSTWSGTHQGWAIELEPLVAYTALIADKDQRLLRESIDWCVLNDAFLSRRQLRHVVTAQHWPFKGPIGRFGATLTKLTKRPWPDAEEPPYDLTPSGKSEPPVLSRPELIQLRLRSVFGVTARAEVLRVLLEDERREWSLADITERVAYTRRQVTTDLEMLTLGGVTRRVDSSGSYRFALENADGLLGWLGPMPAVSIRWAPTFRLMTGLMEIVDTLASEDWRMPSAEVQRQMRALDPQVTELRLRPPSPEASDYVTAVVDWSRELFAALSGGDIVRLGSLAHGARTS